MKVPVQVFKMKFALHIYRVDPGLEMHILILILNPGSLSSEDFLIWACLIEKESSYLQLGGPALMRQFLHMIT